jgi:dihydroflavonol-4-reductase
MRPAFRPNCVLLTGASGTIGSLIGPALLAAGIPLRVLVHRRRPAWLKEGSGVEEREGDVLTPATLRGAADGCDAIVHAAARPGFGALDRERRQRIHIEGTEAVLREASSAGSRLFALIGYTGTIQERRATGEAVDEEQPPEGDYESTYVRMKMESEVLTLEANRPGELRTMVASPGVLFGPGLPSLLSELALLYLRRELPYRLLDDVWLAITGPRDVGAGVLAAIERGRGGRRYFLTGASLRLGDFYAMLSERSGAPAPRRRLPDLLVEEMGLLTPVLPPHSFLRQVVLPRELVHHLRRLTRVENQRTRAELGFSPEPLESLIDAMVGEAGLRSHGGAPGTGP